MQNPSQIYSANQTTPLNELLRFINKHPFSQEDVNWFINLINTQPGFLQSVDSDGNTLLHLACHYGNSTLIEGLLKYYTTESLLPPLNRLNNANQLPWTMAYNQLSSNDTPTQEKLPRYRKILDMLFNFYAGVKHTLVETSIHPRIQLIDRSANYKVRCPQYRLPSLLKHCIQNDMGFYLEKTIYTRWVSRSKKTDEKKSKSLRLGDIHARLQGVMRSIENHQGTGDGNTAACEISFEVRLKKGEKRIWITFPFFIPGKPTFNVTDAISVQDEIDPTQKTSAHYTRLARFAQLCENRGFGHHKKAQYNASGCQQTHHSEQNLYSALSTRAIAKWLLHHLWNKIRSNPDLVTLTEAPDFAIKLCNLVVSMHTCRNTCNICERAAVGFSENKLEIIEQLKRAWKELEGKNHLIFPKGNGFNILNTISAGQLFAKGTHGKTAYSREYKQTLWQAIPKQLSPEQKTARCWNLRTLPPHLVYETVHPNNSSPATSPAGYTLIHSGKETGTIKNTIHYSSRHLPITPQPSTPSPEKKQPSRSAGQQQAGPIPAQPAEEWARERDNLEHRPS